MNYIDIVICCIIGLLIFINIRLSMIHFDLIRVDNKYEKDFKLLLDVIHEDSQEIVEAINRK